MSVGRPTSHPGVAKFRQTGYALGLERKLSKVQILALRLDTQEMGKDLERWITGFHKAAKPLTRQGGLNGADP